VARARVFAANWKMNLGAMEAESYVRTFCEQYAPHSDRTVIFFPPALSLGAVASALRDRPDIAVGVQNIYWQDKGAFTGENSAPMARQSGASYSLVGHSERRHVFGETDAEAGQKCAAAVRGGLIPVLCVGETIEQRWRNETELVVLTQLRAGIERVEPAHLSTMMIAYEPVWAIGTGHTATPQDASAVHEVIRAALLEASPHRGSDIPILYGGSVNGGNVAQLLEAPGVDGVLVGGASLDPSGWAAIART
jgi:triosephosphate isomerase